MHQCPAWSGRHALRCCCSTHPAHNARRCQALLFFQDLAGADVAASAEHPRDGIEAGEIHRPESGDLAFRLFEVLGAIHASVGELTTERDGLLLTIDALHGEIESLKKGAAAPGDEAGEITALKAKLDEANVQYRANASKESLEKLVAELPKE